MNKIDIQQRIDWLRNEINSHNHKYYVLNSPSISDKDFDFLMKELEKLETENPEFADTLSPTQRIGSDLNEGFKQVYHERPMMSLSNTYSIEEVDDWFARVSNTLVGEQFEIVSEIKFDGTSISLVYEHGKLVRAVTRGDGEKGDDVTSNIKTIKSIPLQLLPGNWPDKFEIRGEILLPWQSFEKLNKERADNEEPLFANPRNAAAGTLKMQNSKEVARRNLDARLYYLIGDNLPFDNHYDNMNEARKWGFKVSSAMQILHTLDDVNKYINYWNIERKTLPVASDGLVFKINSARQQLNLGNTAKSPRWAIAYKFNPENACTQLKFVSFETGRMGIITPVANLEPVLLSGTIVKRASLHNDDIMRQLDIHDNDFVYVEKGGEIIPKITGVDLTKRNNNARQITFVDSCPVCGTKLVRAVGESAWICPNKSGCRPQITGKIEHFAARRMMNIDGIGSETVELLFDAGLVKCIADLYSLTIEQLANLDRIGIKLATKIVDGIKSTRNIPFERVLYALSIPNVGETTAKRLAYAAQTIDKLISMSVNELSSIPDIGEIIAKSIVDYMHNAENIRNIEVLRQNKIQLQLSNDKITPHGNSLNGEVVVISGTFSHHSREEYKEIIEQEGGKNVSSISKKTTFVLAGENMGPAKYEKCKKLNIPILSENEFIERITH